MDPVDLAEAKARLSELIDRVEGGASIEMTRRGKPAARLTGVARPRQPIDAAMLKSLTDRMPLRAEAAVDAVRSMRDGSTPRYLRPSQLAKPW
ncbi:MAG: type II toxin-antitoxin system prevent-host-death family antitoxin [Tardiphaga sp.]|nr:type II toxin-antitoxin system prevent-host-death family antitoxin [Tardiphaga sp.]